MNEQTNIHTQTIINKTWNNEGGFEFSFAFAFRNKEQYLSFRRLWKDNYAALSVTLRDPQGCWLKLRCGSSNSRLLGEVPHSKKRRRNC